MDNDDLGRAASGDGGRPLPAGDRDPGLVVGRPFGIPVVVSPSWLIVAALLTWVFQPTVARAVPGIGSGSWLVAFLFAVLLYGSVLVHELSHSVTALRMGLPVRRITVHLLGGVSEIERPPGTPSGSFLIAAAGPAVNFVLAAVGWVVSGFTEPGTVAHVLAYALTGANLVVGLFNLLPGLPLDGGRLLEAAVWRITGQRTFGTLAAAWIGRGLAAVLVLAPLWYAVTGERDPSIVSVVWGLLLASFIWAGANAAIAVARTERRLPALSARALARRAIPVTVDTPVAEAVRRANAAGATALVVVDSAGRAVGLVQDAAVRAMPAERRPWVPVGDVARRLEDGLVIGMQLVGRDLVDALQRRPAHEYLVVDAQGRVYGVLASSDVHHALSAR